MSGGGRRARGLRGGAVYRITSVRQVAMSMMLLRLLYVMHRRAAPFRKMHGHRIAPPPSSPLPAALTRAPMRGSYCKLPLESMKPSSIIASTMAELCLAEMTGERS
jgi:hypothetical protein